MDGIKTYCTDVQVADSACTATAFLGGVKTESDTLGLDLNVVYKDCATQNNPEYHVDSIMTWAQVLNIIYFAFIIPIKKCCNNYRPLIKEQVL